MHIHIERVSAPPFHGLSRSELKSIFSQLPREWLSDLNEVCLTASRVSENTRFGGSDSFFSPFDGTLTIFSRGRTALQLLEPVIVALAGHHLGVPLRRGHRYSKKDLHVIQCAAEPVTNRILKSLKEAESRDAGNIAPLGT